MGRPSDARERLLAAGTRLLEGRAYSAIGVAEIASTAGVPKGSFYYFFPSKQEFAAAVIDRHWIEQRAHWEKILDREEPVEARLRALFDATRAVQDRALRGTGSVVGCMFGNLALELSSTEPTINAQLQDIFDAQVTMIAAAMRDGHSRIAGTEVELVQLATAVVTILEGAVLFAKLRNDPDQIERQWPFAAQLISAQAAPVTS